MLARKDMQMKRVFYYTDMLPLLSREDVAIDKIERNLQVFRDFKDKIEVVWHPQSGTLEYLEKNNSPVKDRYCQIVDKYRSEAFGQFDDSKGFDAAKTVLLSCDAYYGDVCDLVYEAQNAKMPIMIQNVDV